MSNRIFEIFLFKIFICAMRAQVTAQVVTENPAADSKQIIDSLLRFLIVDG